MLTYDEGLTTVTDRLERLVADLQARPHSPSEAWGATFDAGLSRVHFPHGRGGIEVRPELQSVVDSRLASIGVPSNFAAHMGGIGVVAPVLANFATNEQCDQYLRKLFTCEEYWCQLFSEPDAGSDLASLRSTVVRDGDSWILNGHKVWTTMAHIAKRGILLARSSDQPRHQGITCFILDMDSPGIEVRPLRQMTGEAEFNEVFFTDVEIHDSCRIGAVDGGWKIAMGTLMEERNAVNHVLDATVPMIEMAMNVWRSLPEERRTPIDRDRLVALHVRWEVCQLTRQRDIAMQRLGTPGPQGSIVKATMGDLNQDICDFTLELLGADGMLYSTYEMTQPMTWHETSLLPDDPQRAFLRSRAATIEGGTNEMQRNTIGERVLGLPR